MYVCMVEWCIYCNPNDTASIYSDEQSMHVRLGPSGPGRSHVASSKKSFVYVCLYHALCAFMLRGVRYIHMYVWMFVCRRLCRKLGKPQNGCRKCCHCKGGCGSRAPDLPMYVCMYVCMYVLFKPPAHSMHDFVNLGETCCDEAGAQRGPERPREA